jgi:hypothetical protein
MKQPNSLFTFNSITGKLIIKATQLSQVGTFNYKVMAILSKYSSKGYFPQSTIFTLTVSLS